MSIEATINEFTDSIKALTAAINRLHAALPGAQSVTVVPSAPPSPAPVSQPLPAAPVVEAAAPAPTAAPPAEVAVDAPPSLDAVRAALVNLGKIKGRPALTGLLSHYGATKISDVPADKLAQLLADAKRAEAA